MKNISKFTFLTALLLTSVSMAQSTNNQQGFQSDIYTNTDSSMSKAPQYFLGHGIGMNGDHYSASTMSEIATWLAPAASSVSNNSYNQYDNIYNQSQVLQYHIKNKGNPDPEVPKILIGYSMGGLRARSYLQFSDDPSISNVKGLITIDTPHNGAPIMNNGAPIMNNGPVFLSNIGKNIALALSPDLSLSFGIQDLFVRGFIGHALGELVGIFATSIASGGDTSLSFEIPFLKLRISFSDMVQGIMKAPSVIGDTGSVVLDLATANLPAFIKNTKSIIEFTSNMMPHLTSGSPLALNVGLSQSGGTREDLTPDSNFLKAANNLQRCFWITEEVTRRSWWWSWKEKVRKQICSNRGSIGQKIPNHIKTMSIRGTGQSVTNHIVPPELRLAPPAIGAVTGTFAILQFGKAWTCWGCSLPSAWGLANLSYTFFNLDNEWTKVVGSPEGDAVVPLKSQDMYGFFTPAQIGGTPAIFINGQPNAAASARNVEGASHIGLGGVLNNKGTKIPIAEYQKALKLPEIDRK